MTPPRTITVAFTGASGLPYGVRLVECLLQAGCRVWLLYSQVAQIVARQEMDWSLPARPAEVEAELSARFAAAPGQLRVFGREEWFAPPASGSNPPDAMVVCPCTVATLASIAGGLSQNLIERAADVVIKEGRKLVLVPRETPYSALHLENMLKLARLGVCILPPNPGFSPPADRAGPDRLRRRPHPRPARRAAQPDGALGRGPRARRLKPAGAAAPAHRSAP